MDFDAICPYESGVYRCSYGNICSNRFVAFKFQQQVGQFSDHKSLLQISAFQNVYMKQTWPQFQKLKEGLESINVNLHT